MVTKIFKSVVGLWVALVPVPTVIQAETPVDSQAVISNLVVVLVDQASIAATIDGSVSEVRVAEGDSLVAGDLLIQLDNAKTLLEQSLADRALKIAEHHRDTTDAIDAEAAKVAERERLIAEQTVRSERNQSLAANRLKVQAAEKAEAVARNEWTRGKSAKQNFSDAVSESEIDALRLAYERSQLETQEAIFQRELAAIDVRLDASIAATLEQNLKTAQVALAAARSSQRIRNLEAEIAKLQAELAAAAAADHQLRSPIDGLVVGIHASVGDWVRRGQIVARVIGLKRLRAEGFTSPARAATLRSADDIRVIIILPDGTRVTRRGSSKFVSPEIDAVTGEVHFWIEFDNAGQDLHPGLKAGVEIH